jgi:hypothetical protein
MTRHSASSKGKTRHFALNKSKQRSSFPSAAMQPRYQRILGGGSVLA